MTMPNPDGAALPTRALELEVAKFARIARSRGWTDRDSLLFDRIAYELGISERTAYRVLGCEIRPQVPFIAGLLTAGAGLSLRGAFRLVNANDPIGRE
jgi:hypothetical protein